MKTKTVTLFTTLILLIALFLPLKANATGWIWLENLGDGSMLVMGAADQEVVGYQAFLPLPPTIDLVSGYMHPDSPFPAILAEPGYMFNTHIVGFASADSQPHSGTFPLAVLEFSGCGNIEFGNLSESIATMYATYNGPDGWPSDLIAETEGASMGSCVSIQPRSFSKSKQNSQNIE